MAQRRLALHASALSDAEYAVYTASLKDLVLGDSDAHEVQGEDDEYFARMQMGVREARAWLRGRYADVPVQTIDTILRFFSASLAPGDTMSGTEFFVALRLVVHASNGAIGGAQEVDRGMAFVQADPTQQNYTHPHTSNLLSTPASTSSPASRHGSTPSSRAQSPTKRYNPFASAQPQPHLHTQSPHLARDPPPPQHPQHPSLAHAHSSYASYRRDAHSHSNSRAESVSVSAAGSGAGAGSVASRPRSQGQSSAHSQGHNPFSTATTVHTVPIASSSTSASVPPQIPPRKPPSEGSAALASGSGAQLTSTTSSANKRKSAPPVPPPRSSRAGRDDRDRSMSPTKNPNVNVSRSGSVMRPAPPVPLPPSGLASSSTVAHPTLSQHVTTPLMRQSLHAAQIGQSLQRAEARMEKERVMQVLRTSAGPSAGSVDAGGTSDPADDRGRAPPLPQRRPSGRVPPPPPAQGSKPGASAAPGAAREARGRQQLPSPPSSMGSMGSLEKVALAGDDRSKNPDRQREREREREAGSRSPTKPAPPPPPAHPQRRRETVSSGGSPNAGYAEPGASTSASTPSRPPPTHPDRARRNLESFEAVYGPSLAFPSTENEHTQTVARSPFSPISPSPPASASPSMSRYDFNREASPGYGPAPGRATPPGVTPRVVRSKSMHHTPPPPSPPVYGTGAGAATPASRGEGPTSASPFSPFASAVPAQSKPPLLSPAPPPPPARRKRPESFQVLPSSLAMAHTNSNSSSHNSNGYTNNTGPGGPFGLVSPTTGSMNAYGVVAAAGYGASMRDVPVAGGMGYVPPAKKKAPDTRRSSQGSNRGGSGGEKSDGEPDAQRDVFAALAKDTAPSGRERPSPITGLKQTFASANAALLPTLERAREGLDKARYKAEAGLSRRGYMRHGVGYGYAGGVGARGEGDADVGDEAPLGDARGGGAEGGEEDEEELRGAVGGLSIARERDKDRARERQEMAGLVGGADGRMKAPSVHYNAKRKKEGESRDAERDPATQHAYGYGLERDWDSDEDRPSVDAGPDVESEVDHNERLRGARGRGLGGEKDNLKWPAGEGWKPL